MCVCVCVCVRVKEEERDRESVCVIERERERSKGRREVSKKESQCVSFKSVGINVNGILKNNVKTFAKKKKKFNGFSK